MQCVFQQPAKCLCCVRTDFPHWNIPKLMLTSGILSGFVLVLSFAVFFAGRERRHFWQSVPSRWMQLASPLDIIVVFVFAVQGILMTAIPAGLVAGLGR